jgi:hypothetical protein
MLIVGSELLQRQDGDTLLAAAMRIADSAQNTPPGEEWKVLNVLQKVCITGHSIGRSQGGHYLDNHTCSVPVKWELWTLATDLDSLQRD